MRKRRSRPKLARRDPAIELGGEWHSKGIRREAKRKREVVLPAFRQYDALSPFDRALQSFYGPAKVGAAAQHLNPEEIPARLGNAAEFWLYWDEYRKVLAPSPVKQEGAKAATRALGEFF